MNLKVLTSNTASIMGTDHAPFERLEPKRRARRYSSSSSSSSDSDDSSDSSESNFNSNGLGRFLGKQQNILSGYSGFEKEEDDNTIVQKMKQIINLKETLGMKEAAKDAADRKSLLQSSPEGRQRESILARYRDQQQQEQQNIGTASKASSSDEQDVYTSVPLSSLLERLEQERLEMQQQLDFVANLNREAEIETASVIADQVTKAHLQSKKQQKRKSMVSETGIIIQDSANSIADQVARSLAQEREREALEEAFAQERLQKILSAEIYSGDEFNPSDFKSVSTCNEELEMYTPTDMNDNDDDFRSKPFKPVSAWSDDSDFDTTASGACTTSSDVAAVEQYAPQPLLVKPQARRAQGYIDNDYNNAPLSPSRESKRKKQSKKSKGSNSSVDSSSIDTSRKKSTKSRDKASKRDKDRSDRKVSSKTDVADNVKSEKKAAKKSKEVDATVKSPRIEKRGRNTSNDKLQLRNQLSEYAKNQPAQKQVEKICVAPVRSMRSEIKALITKVMPQEAENYRKVIQHFRGREDELLATLQQMERELSRKEKRSKPQGGSKDELNKSRRKERTVDKEIKGAAAVAAADSKSQRKEKSSHTKDKVVKAVDDKSLRREKSSHTKGKDEKSQRKDKSSHKQDKEYKVPDDKSLRKEKPSLTKDKEHKNTDDKSLRKEKSSHVKSTTDNNEQIRDKSHRRHEADRELGRSRRGREKKVRQDPDGQVFDDHDVKSNKTIPKKSNRKIVDRHGSPEDVDRQARRPVAAI